MERIQSIISMTLHSKTWAKNWLCMNEMQCNEFIPTILKYKYVAYDGLLSSSYVFARHVPSCFSLFPYFAHWHWLAAGGAGAPTSAPTSTCTSCWRRHRHHRRRTSCRDTMCHIPWPSFTASTYISSIHGYWMTDSRQPWWRWLGNAQYESICTMKSVTKLLHLY